MTKPWGGGGAVGMAQICSRLHTTSSILFYLHSGAIQFKTVVWLLDSGLQRIPKICLQSREGCSPKGVCVWDPDKFIVLSSECKLSSYSENWYVCAWSVHLSNVWSKDTLLEFVEEFRKLEFLWKWKVKVNRLSQLKRIRSKQPTFSYLSYCKSLTLRNLRSLIRKERREVVS